MLSCSAHRLKEAHAPAWLKGGYLHTWCESSQWMFGSSCLSQASSGLWFRHVRFLATVLGFFVFSPNHSNRAFSRLGGFFVVSFYQCDSLCRLQGA